MPKLLDCVIDTIFNKPDNKKWKLIISEKAYPRSDQFLDNNSDSKAITTVFWCHNLYSKPIRIENKDMNIDAISTLFLNSGLMVNIIQGINSRNQTNLLTLKIKEIDLTSRHISREWKKIWHKLINIRILNIQNKLDMEYIKSEITQIEQLILRQLSLFPYNTNWKIKITQEQIKYKKSLDSIIYNLQQENFQANYKKMPITRYVMHQNINQQSYSNNSNGFILNIKRKPETNNIFRKYISQNTNSLEQRFPDLCCPISHNLMINPVILGNTGHTYDRESITLALSHKPNIDPISNQIIENNSLTPNYTLINIIKKIIIENEPKLIFNS